MADSKVSGLTALGAITGDDLLYAVDDPASTSLSRKIPVQDFLNSLTTQVLYNLTGAPAGSADYTFDATTVKLGLGVPVASAQATVDAKGKANDSVHGAFGEFWPMYIGTDTNTIKSYVGFNGYRNGTNYIFGRDSGAGDKCGFIEYDASNSGVRDFTFSISDGTNGADGTIATMTKLMTIEEDGTITANTASYEALVTASNDLPNKAYVDSLTSKNTEEILVIDGAAAIAGKVYPTVTAALVYTAASTPSETNRFAVRVSGTNSESWTQQNWVHIIGDALGATRLTGTITFAPLLASQPISNSIQKCTIEGTVIADGSNYCPFYFCELSGGSGNGAATGIINAVDCIIDDGDWTNINLMNIIGGFVNEENGGNLILPSDVVLAQTQVQAAPGAFSGGTFYETYFTQQCTSSTLTGGSFIFNACTFTATGFVIATGETWGLNGCTGRATSTGITVDSGGSLNSDNCTNFTITNNGTWNNSGALYNNATSGLTATDDQAAIDEIVADLDVGGGLTRDVYSAALADDAEISLADATTGFGTVMIGDSQEWADFSWTSAGVVTLKAVSTNVVATDTDANLCIYDGGTAVNIKNRLGSELTLRYRVEYS